MEINSGCLECKDRHIGCHGACERYKAYREKIDERNKRAKMAYLIGKGRAYLPTYKIKRAAQCKKRKERWS